MAALDGSHSNILRSNLGYNKSMADRVDSTESLSRPKTFSERMMISRDCDGWLTPDGDFFISNRLGEKQLHGECADYIYKIQKDRVLERMRVLGTTMDKDDEENLPARVILGRAGYLLISHRMPQYGFISGELTPIQVGSLANSGFDLPPEVSEIFESKLQDKQQLLAELKTETLPVPVMREVLEKVNRLYTSPGVGISFSNIGNFVGERAEVQVNFDHEEISRKLFLELTKKGSGDEVAFDIDRELGGGVKVRYKKLGDELAVVLEEKSHSINERLDMNAKDFVIEDFWIYVQTLDWIARRYERGMKKTLK